MGAWISASGIEKIAPRAVSNHHNVLHRLYEQTRHLPQLQQQMRVEQYLVRWNRRAESLLGIKRQCNRCARKPGSQHLP